jgi:hypothetical protein
MRCANFVIMTGIGSFVNITRRRLPAQSRHRIRAVEFDKDVRVYRSRKIVLPRPWNWGEAQLDHGRN